MYAAVPMIPPGWLNADIVSAPSVDAPAVEILLGEAEVHDLGIAARRHHDVGGLDVAMEDAVRVRLAQGVDDLNGARQDLVQTERRPAQPRVERFALDVLHRDVLAAVGFADFVDGADVRMIERGGRARLSQQAPAREGIGLRLRRQEFQGDAAAELQVIGEKHLGHPASPELGANDVSTELLTRGSRTHGSDPLLSPDSVAAPRPISAR